MKRGRDLEAMYQVKTLLEEGMKIDPRGGHFSQPHMEDLVKATYSKEEYTAKAAELAAKGGFSFNELVSDTAFAVRCMFSHVRISCNDFLKAKRDGTSIDTVTHPEWLVSVYAMMDVKIPEKKSGKEDGDGNPFVNWQHLKEPAEVDSSDSESVAGERGKIVFQGYCHRKGDVIRRYADGSVEDRLRLEPGSDGLVKGIFKEGGVEVEVLTKVPITRLKDGRILARRCLHP